MGTGLEGLGAKVFIGHRSENIGAADVVVFSSAVSKNDPELVEARRRMERLHAPERTGQSVRTRQ